MVLPFRPAITQLVAGLVLGLLSIQVLALERIALNEDDLLVLEAGIEDFDLSETLFVYQQPETTLIPLQGLFDLLDFPLQIDVASQTVNGWFIHEDNRFSLDIGQKTLFIKGKKLKWPRSQYYAADDFDLYFDYRLLERWFGLHLRLNVSRLVLNVSSDVELPVVLQARRLQKRRTIREETSSSVPDSYHPNRYQWLGDPRFDLEISDDFQHTRGKFQQFPGAVLQGRMDLLQHSMRVSYVNADSTDDLRLTFSRFAPGPDKAMFMGLTEYEFGDVSSRSDSLLYASIKGRGLNLVSGTGAQLDKVDEVDIDGDAPPGWEVELYRNGSLIAFGNSESNGRYEFNGISTFVGQNIFDIRIYGPQGQFRSRREEINIGPGMIKTGEWGYHLSALERNRHLVDLEDETRDDVSDFFQTDVSYGVNEYLTLQAGISQTTPDSDTEAHRYSSLDAFASVRGAFTHFKYVDDADSGSAAAAVIKGSWNEINLNAEFLKFDSFISDANPGGLKNSDVKLGVNGSSRFVWNVPVTYEFEYKDTGFTLHDRHQRSLRNRLGFNVFSANVSHEMQYTRASLDDQKDSLVANISANKRFSQWRLKAELNYFMMPTGRVNSYGVGATWKQSSDFVYQGQLNYSLSGADELAVNNTFTWELSHVALSVSAGFTNKGTQTAGLSLSTSFGYDRGQHQFLISKDHLSTGGSATARVYLDKNHDGIFNADDQPIKGVSFKGRANWRDQASDDSGLSTLSGVSPRDFQRIELDEASLGDPFLQPLKSVHYLYTHEGATNYIEFPVVETLEIEGSVVLLKQGREKIMSGVPVQLISEQGELIVQSVSEFDGVFIIEKVIPGTYRLEVPADFLYKNKLMITASQSLSVEGDEGVLYLEPIQLKNW